MLLSPATLKKVAPGAVDREMLLLTRARSIALVRCFAVGACLSAGLACGGGSAGPTDPAEPEDALPADTLVAGGDSADGDEPARARPAPGASRVDTGAIGSELDRAVVREINLLRTNPRGYARHLRELRSHYRGNRIERPGEVAMLTHEGVAAVDEAIAVLSKTRPMPALKTSRGLHLAARDHAADVGPRGSLDHVGSDGTTPNQRMQRYGDVSGLSAENMDFGFDRARDVIMHLIVDDGVQNRGHRVNLLTPSFRFVGVACGPHARFDTVCVMNFADGYADR